MAERMLEIDGETCTVPSLPMTAAELRTAFPDRIAADRALWRFEGTIDRPTMVEVADTDVIDAPGYFYLFTAPRDPVAAAAGDPRLLTEAFAAGALFQTARGPARALPPERNHFSNGKHRVVACDPNLLAGAQPLDRALPKATITCSIARARFDDPRLGLRNTCAALFAWPRRRIVHWEPTSPARYGVDYGIGCFVKDNVAAGLAKGGPRYQRLTSQVNAREARVQCVSVGPATVIAFDSGLGDGTYASYWGLDDAGAVLALVTDFGILAR